MLKQELLRRALAAGEAWERMGLSGLITPDRYINHGEALLDVHIGFIKANTFHFLTRHNWRNFLNFMQKHLA